MISVLSQTYQHLSDKIGATVYLEVNDVKLEGFVVLELLYNHTKYSGNSLTRNLITRNS